MKYTLCLVLMLVACFANATDLKYPVSTIPVELKQNADAVVRLYTVDKNIESKIKQVTNHNLVITILNNKADDLSRFSEHHDPLRKISNCKMFVYNKFGKQVYKAKSNDFEDVKAYSQGSLFDDNRLLVNEYHTNAYPYTVEFSYTTTDLQTLFIGSWLPIVNYNVSVESAELVLSVERSFTYRFLEENMPSSVQESVSDNYLVRKWSVKNLPAIESEPYMPSWDKVLPNVRFAPNEFNYDGVDGSMDTWKAFGQWDYDLIIGRDQLAATTQSVLLNLTKDATSIEEKTRIVYDYLQQNTRYVSVQLGIGGFQPFQAHSVDETKYGDCKALSNYMKAMLKIVGVEAFYTTITSRRNFSDINIDFPSQQFNHIIVCVPNGNDSIWLECTSQTTPFGFIGSGNHNRHVLLATKDGGELVKTIEYTADMNTQNFINTAVVDSSGSVKFSSEGEFKAIQYEQVSYFSDLSPEEQKEKLYERLNIPNSIISSYSFTQNKTKIPSAEYKMEGILKNYANINGSRMFLPLNITTKMRSVPKRMKERKFNIVKNYSYIDTDTTVFELPKGYNLEYLPKSVELITSFGEYSASVKQSDGKLTYMRKLKINKGEYDASEYDNFRKFYKDIARADQAKLVLIK